MRVILLLLLAAWNVCLGEYLVRNPDYYQLDAYTWESEEFRAMRLGEAVSALKRIDPDRLTEQMIRREYDMTEAGERDAAEIEENGTDGRALRLNPIEARRPVEYRKLRNAYETIFADLRCFPIPSSTRPDTPEISYEDGWMDRRTYGGERGHEGCDIMGTGLPRGSYPVVSISDGVVETVGWLEKGGWRIGIRTASGLFLYYAHLYDYAQEWETGDRVRAGELLGFMGDSGYGTEPGTVGNFDVHLHVGMYLRTDHYEELSVNPYWILKYLEKYRLSYDY